MANESDLELVAENKKAIQKNKRSIFELEAGVSTTYAELMLLLSDIVCLQLFRLYKRLQEH